VVGINLEQDTFAVAVCVGFIIACANTIFTGRKRWAGHAATPAVVIVELELRV